MPAVHLDLPGYIKFQRRGEARPSTGMLVLEGSPSDSQWWIPIRPSDAYSNNAQGGYVWGTGGGVTKSLKGGSAYGKVEESW